MSPDAVAPEAPVERKEQTCSARPAAVALPIGLAVLFLVLHLPYLPASLEDHDSINFALGVREFDVARHQPHPPGYPVFIVIAKALRAAVRDEVTALALVSICSAALGVLALAWLFRLLDEDRAPARWSVGATAVAMTTPLYWFTAVRPLSDSSGLAAALAVQAMTLAASTPRALAAAAFCAGLAAGLRSQVVWLTLPLLMFQSLITRGSVDPDGNRSEDLRIQRSVVSLALFAAGILVWFVPLVIVTGGLSAYWHTLADQGAEDLGNIQMLWNNHGVRDITDALYYAFVSPWAHWPVAAVALILVVFGLWRCQRHQQRALIVLAVAFGPYLIFDLLFQETFTTRYALPLIAPMAYLAVMGLRLAPWDFGLAGVVALAMCCAHIGGTSIAAYSRATAPAFRLLETMRMVSQREPVVPVLAMDRRQSLDLLRPMMWAGAAMPKTAATLPAPPQHEWLEPVRYWNSGGSAPVWFVVDPRRTSIDLVQHGAPMKFRWTVPYPVLLSGARPGEMDWYRVDRPEWYVADGWSLTPEAAGVSDADGRGPSRQPITGWVHGSSASGGTLMIGGRSFDPTQRPRLTVTLSGRPLLDEVLMPGPFLKFVSLPFAQRDIAAPAYDALTVTASAGSRVAVEQFDASATRTLVGFDQGWHEQEFNPRTGVRWRWLSERGELKLAGLGWRPPAEDMSRPADLQRLVLHLEGESPLTYFPRSSRLVVKSADRIVLDRALTGDFSLDVPIADAADTIVLETDQTYIPAERSRRTADRRHLGLRIFKAEIRKAERPAS